MIGEGGQAHWVDCILEVEAVWAPIALDRDCGRRSESEGYLLEGNMRCGLEPTRARRTVPMVRTILFGVSYGSRLVNWRVVWFMNQSMAHVVLTLTM
jgi:hypothetical protein